MAGISLLDCVTPNSVDEADGQVLLDYYPSVQIYQ